MTEAESDPIVKLKADIEILKAALDAIDQGMEGVIGEVISLALDDIRKGQTVATHSYRLAHLRDIIRRAMQATQ